MRSFGALRRIARCAMQPKQPPEPTRRTSYARRTADSTAWPATRTSRALKKAHQDVTLQDTDGAKKLKKTSVGDDVCLSCHANDYTAEATADVTALVDSNGTTVNPHDLPATSKHEQNITCSSCHDMHSDSSVEETATSLCLSCHHKNVYECNTCHEP